MRNIFVLVIFLAVPLLVHPQREAIDTRVDQMRYWMKLAAEGVVPYNQYKPVRRTLPASASATPWGQLSPDIRMGDKKNTRSENSVTTIPGQPYTFLSGNNLSDQPVTWLFGADALVSGDGGTSWTGKEEGAGGDNNGDPAVDCDLAGRVYSGRIARNRGQAVAWSDNRGVTWQEVQVASPAFSNDIFDKNHLCVDRSPASPFVGRVYVAWSYFGSGPADGHVFLSYSSDRGISWSQPVVISQAVNNVYLHHGVNLRTGPGGELYAVWSVYDNWPGDESALVFARSTDGGVSFEPAKRIGPVVRGNRHSLTPKQMRVNAFPAMAVDCSAGPYQGTITVVWSNKGVPGENLGRSSDVWCVRSADRGDTWSLAQRISQNNAPEPHTSFFPWICSDDATGHLFAVYYDDRFTDTLSCETWVASSFDGGTSWLEFPVSDVAFTPQPIVGMAASYFGDYIGITASNDVVCPVWTDNRDGTAASWCSPFNAVDPASGQHVTLRRWWLENGQGEQTSVVRATDTSLIHVALVNNGSTTLVNRRLVLTSSSGLLTVVSGSMAIPPLSPGDSVVINGVAALTASVDAPDRATVECVLKAEGDDTLTLQSVFLPVGAPVPELVMTVVGEESLMANGAPDAGESFTLILSFSNVGTILLPAGSLALLCNVPGFLCTTPEMFFEEMAPGDTTTFFLSCQWPEGVVTGDRLPLNIRFQNHPFTFDFRLTLATGVMVVDWEGGSMNSLPWSNTPDQPWSIDSTERHSGRFALRSASPPDNGRSVLSISYYVAKADSISFWLRTESEQKYDELVFRIGNNDKGAWSGRTDWQRVSFAVDSGYQTFTWLYQKDIFNGLWRDCGWIDDLQLPPLAPSWISLSDTAICTSDTAVSLMGAGAHFSRLRWFTQGDGIFSSQQGLAAVYEPGTDDRSVGSVRLYGITYGNLNQATDTMVLYLQDVPVSPVITLMPASYCRGASDSVHLSVPALPWHTVRWMADGDSIAAGGHFSHRLVAPDNTVVYSAWLVNACGVSDTTTAGLNVFPVPDPALGADTAICNGASISFYAGDQFVAYLWNTGDTGVVTQIHSSRITGDALVVAVRVVNEFGCVGQDSVSVRLAGCRTDNFGKFTISTLRTQESLLVSCNGCEDRFVAVRIYNVSGQEVLELRLNGAGIDGTMIRFANQASGVYFFNAVDVAGKGVSGKFVW